MWWSLLLSCAKGGAVEAAPGGDRPLLLWEVRRDDAVSHVLGTCHVGVPLDEALPAPYAAMVAEARVLVVEADIASATPAEMVGLVVSDGPPLSARLSEADWLAVARAARSQIPAVLLDRMPPWVVALSLQTLPSVGSTGEGEPPVVAMDAELMRRAQQAGVPLRALETLKEQAALLSGLDDHFLTTLKVTAPAPDDATDRAVVALCRGGDLSKVSQLYPEGDPTQPILLDQRNLAWNGPFLEELAKGGALVAVGAGHLVGPTGLLAQAEAGGYSVRQLRTDVPASSATFTSFSAGLGAAEPLPEAFASMQAQLAATMAGELCLEGQLVRDCFEPDAVRCEARMRADVGLCALQWADRIFSPDPAVRDEVSQTFGACVSTGLAVDAFLHGLPDKPSCAPIEAAMKAALGG